MFRRGASRSNSSASGHLCGGSMRGMRAVPGDRNWAGGLQCARQLHQKGGPVIGQHANEMAPWRREAAQSLLVASRVRGERSCSPTWQGDLGQA
eukprot:7301351-Alexandrium_andersonii.AAC.1